MLHATASARIGILRAYGWALLCAGSLPAQNATIPPDFDQQDGDIYSIHSAYTPSRMIANYAPHVSGLKGGNRIFALYVRTDDLESGKPVRGAHKNVTVATRLSSGGVTGRAFSFPKWLNFEGTHKGPWSKKVVVDFPGASSASPEPWVRLPLAAAYVVAADGSLAIDVKLWTTKAEIVGDYLDAQKPMNLGKFIRLGTSCPRSLELTGGEWFFGSTRMNSSVPATVSRKHALGDVVISWLDARPVRVSPGFNYGSDPCSLYVLPVVVHPLPVAITGAKSSAVFIWAADRLFGNPAVKGARVYAQHAVLTKSGQVQLTHGLAITVGWGWSKGWGGLVTAFGLHWSTSGNKFDPDKDPVVGQSPAVPVIGVIKG